MNTMVYNIIFLPVIITLGIITSYQDISYSRILNKWIVIGLSFSLFVFISSSTLCFSYIRNFITIQDAKIVSSLTWRIDKWCINLIISMLVGYLLWRYKMWGAGDAKLFIVYASLIPMGKYSIIYFNYYFVSFLLLLAIFIPATIFFLIQSVFHFFKKFDFRKARLNYGPLLNKLTSKISVKRVLWITIGYMIFVLFFKIISQETQKMLVKYVIDKNVLMIILLLIFKPLSKAFRKSKSIGFIIALLIMYFVLSKEFLKAGFIADFFDLFIRAVIIMGLVTLCKKLIYSYSEKVFNEITPFAHWMFLGAIIVWFCF